MISALFLQIPAAYSQDVALVPISSQQPYQPVDAKLDPVAPKIEKISSDFIKVQSPELLTYPELVRLSRYPNPGGALSAKVDQLFTTPIINNEAHYTGYKPRRPVQPELGPMVRLLSWNTEKSIGFDALVTAFTSPTRFQNLIDTARVPVGSGQYQEAMGQRAILESCDVLLFQEMDIGMKRSNYRDSVKELAKALRMNYAFGTEQIEIDPVNLGMKEEFTYDDGRVEERLYRTFQVDPEKYKGLIGSAVLSRYPVKRAEVFQLKNQPYDWYFDEMQIIAPFKKVSRVDSQQEFLAKIEREMRVGGRIYFRVDLEVPGLPENTLTIINVNLEPKTDAFKRELQLKEILGYIREIQHPVVLAGNFNSASGDLSAFTAKREIRRAITDPNFLISPVISVLVPGGLFMNVTRQVLNFSKNYHNPSGGNFPVLAPNRVRSMFETLERFRFVDGKTFDFRGSPKRSINAKMAPLANSNEKAGAGYKTTFDTYQSLYNITGSFKLDWIFVKPANLMHPFDPKGAYQFSPHFGMTLQEMNRSLTQSISDHSPVVVDLPIGEPMIEEYADLNLMKQPKKPGMKG